jgi:hypothetical protein
MNKLNHHNSWCANTTSDWFPTDTQELYEQHLNDPVKKQQLEKFGWINADITYVNNSHGFRTPEFNSLENFITVGCSFTYGIGLPQRCVWPELVSQHVDIPVYNLGIGGGSVDTCYRLLKHYIPLIKPKFVIMLQPQSTRLEIFLDHDRSYIHSPGFPNNLNFQQDQWIKHWYTNTKNIDIHLQKNIDAITYVCNKYSVDFYLYPDYYIYNPSSVFLKNRKLSLARDLMHPGVLFHQRLAAQMVQDIKNKNTHE